MFELNEEIEIRSGLDHKKPWTKAFFIGLNEQNHYCTRKNLTDYSIDTWTHARKISVKTYAPFTGDTFPLNSWLRQKDTSIKCHPSEVDIDGVFFGDKHCDFSIMLDEFEISTDWGKTWTPAGVENEA